MATIKNFPNNADEYIGAEYVMKWLHGRTSGVFGADGNLAVSANDNMTVSVSDGVGWMANSKADGCVIWNDTEATGGSKLQLTVGLANSSLPRIDRVVVSLATVDYSEKPTIEILQGSPASRPQPPALTNTTLKRQISLAQIRVAAAASRITASDITDERMDETVCGLVTESVGVDTSVMQAQFEELLDTIQGLLGDLQGGTSAMLKAVYDPQGMARDVFAFVVANSTYKYAATLKFDSWEGDGPYSQTVAIEPIDGGPDVKPNFGFYSPPMCGQVTDTETRQKLLETLALINNSDCTLGDGQITVSDVQNKPTTDIEVVWTLKKGGA